MFEMNKIPVQIMECSRSLNIVLCLSVLCVISDITRFLQNNNDSNKDDKNNNNKC